MVGRPAAAERWADAVEHAMTAPDADTAAQTPPDGSTTVADLLEDEPDRADATLALTVEVGMAAGALPAASTALAEQALE